MQYMPMMDGSDSLARIQVSMCYLFYDIKKGWFKLHLAQQIHPSLFFKKNAAVKVPTGNPNTGQQTKHTAEAGYPEITGSPTDRH